MNNRILNLLVVFACMAALTCCEDPPDNPLVGLWEEAVNPSNWDDSQYLGHCEGVDFAYGGTWLFENDGSYQLDFDMVTIAGVQKGFSFGTYDLTSDSVLILDVTYYEYQDSVFNVDSLYNARKDTHYATITDTMFTERSPVSPCLRFWRRLE